MATLAMLAFAFAPLVSEATFIAGVPSRWSTSFGDFELTDLVGGGGTNAISARYDVGTEAFQLTSNYLPALVTGLSPPFQPVGNVIFSLDAVVTDAGVFESGAYTMAVGPAGVAGLALPTGAPLISGTVLELASTWSTIPSTACGGTVCYVSDSAGLTPALLAVDFAAPELNLRTDYLTLIPYVGAPLFGIRANNPWSTSFESHGNLGWTLFGTVKVPEPSILGLLGLAAILSVRRLKVRATRTSR